MKKINLIAVALVLTMLLTACRGNKKETTPTTMTTTPTTRATTATTSPTTMFTEPTMDMIDPSMDTHGNIGDRDNGIIGDDSHATDSTENKKG